MNGALCTSHCYHTIESAFLAKSSESLLPHIHMQARKVAQHLVGGPIAIFDAPDEAEGLVALALHVHDCVHYVLQHPRPSYVSSLQ